MDRANLIWFESICCACECTEQHGVLPSWTILPGSSECAAEAVVCTVCSTQLKIVEGENVAGALSLVYVAGRVTGGRAPGGASLRREEWNLGQDFPPLSAMKEVVRSMGEEKYVEWARGACIIALEPENGGVSSSVHVR